jgi:glycerol-3-phosphate dehydrogenase
MAGHGHAPSRKHVLTPITGFSPTTREKNIKAMSEEVFDLVVIGGGITGAGVARDAASRGMSVALVEMQDFAQGTSSRSSKLIHGGIRYLENLEFGLVFEALSERRLLFDIAPNLVHPLRFVLPLYKDARVGMFKMGLGMWLYDALSMFEAPELHERLDARESIERLPLLQRRELVGSYVYSDAYMDDDRLVHETLRSASNKGALAANFVTANDAQMTNGKVSSIGCTDTLSGKKFNIRGRHFISSVGPWTDELANSLFHDWKKILRPSKGVHLTFSRDRLQLTEAVVMAEGKRIVFGIPRHEMCIVGTTDTDYSGDPKDVSATEEDVHYLLNVANQYFPGAKLTASDIIASYAGVRPLVDDGSATEGKTSREHVIIDDPRNVTFVAGGKYTTYRRMAAQTVEAALQNFPLEEQVKFQKNETKTPLNDKATPSKMDEALRAADDWSKEFHITKEAAHFLAGRHGLEALDILEAARLRHGSGNHEHASSDETLWTAEAHHAIHHTMCINLIDFYVRRSPLFLARQDHGLPLVAMISKVFARELGWSDSKRQQEAASVQQHVRKELAWKQAFDVAQV